MVLPPALLTRIETPPSWAAAASTATRSASASVTSTAEANPSISLAVASAAVPVDVEDRHGGSFGGEAPARGPADARPTPGDHGPSSFEQSHVRHLRRCGRGVGRAVARPSASRSSRFRTLPWGLRGSGSDRNQMWVGTLKPASRSFT